MAAAVIVLLSHADSPPVQPIDERAAKAERHEWKAEVEKDPVGKPIPNSPARLRKVVKRIVRVKRLSPTAITAPSSTPKRQSHARAKHRRSHAKRHHSTRRHRSKGAPVTPAAAPSKPAATPAPAQSAPAPAPAAQPVPAPEERPVEIALDDGDLATGFNYLVYNKGERVRLHVTSDASVVVQIPGYGIYQPIAAGGDALIEFDAYSSGTYEVKLPGSKGLTLALIRVRD